jgi:hypothetical protein
MLHRVNLLRTDVSEECIPSIMRVTRIGELRTALAATSIVFLRSLRLLLVIANVHSSLIIVNLMTRALSSSERLVLTRATQHNTLEYGIL